jgi:hypothetical protein
MLDNLRDSASKSPFFQEEQSPPEETTASTMQPVGGIFLGMNAIQRLILAVIVFLMTCVVGSFCLLITEKIVIP